MISIGDFARLGRVSVRMLRHYIHRGPIEGVDAVYQLLHTWVRDHGLTDTGRGREVYLECPDDTSEWITEVQVEFTR